MRVAGNVYGVRTGSGSGGTEREVRKVMMKRRKSETVWGKSWVTSQQKIFVMREQKSVFIRERERERNNEHTLIAWKGCYISN